METNAKVSARCEFMTNVCELFPVRSANFRQSDITRFMSWFWAWREFRHRFRVNKTFQDVFVSEFINSIPDLVKPSEDFQICVGFFSINIVHLNWDFLIGISFEKQKLDQDALLLRDIHCHLFVPQCFEMFDEAERSLPFVEFHVGGWKRKTVAKSDPCTWMWLDEFKESLSASFFIDTRDISVRMQFDVMCDACRRAVSTSATDYFSFGLLPWNEFRSQWLANDINTRRWIDRCVFRGIHLFVHQYLFTVATA
jgi:hypothetical protein